MSQRILPAALCLAVLVSAPCSSADGIDKLYQKPDSAVAWGELVADFVGYRGFTKSYALVVGVSQYTGGYKPLPTAQDPTRVREFLLNEAGFDHVHVLTEDKANHARIRELMVDVFPNLVDENDRFLFYWSGHGDQRPNARGGYVGYLPLADSKMGQYASMISMADIRRWDDLLRARQALFLLDACFSGLAGSVSQSPQRTLKVDQLVQPAHHIVTAGTGDEQTIAGDRWEGSIFTDSVLAAIRGEADASTGRFPRDGVVSLHELMEYVQTRVAIERDAVGWAKSITPQIRDLRGSPGQFFFLTNQRKIANLEQRGLRHEGGFQHGLPVAKGDVHRPAPTCDAVADRLFWDSVKNEDERAYFEAYLARVESGQLCGLFADLARLKVAVEPPVADTEDVAALQPQEVEAADPPNVEVVRTEEVRSPQSEPVQISRNEIRQAQEMLTSLGLDPGVADGLAGPKTRAAIMAFQESVGAEVTGELVPADEAALARAVAGRLAMLEENPDPAPTMATGELPDTPDVTPTAVVTERAAAPPEAPASDEGQMELAQAPIVRSVPETPFWTRSLEASNAKNMAIIVPQVQEQLVEDGFFIVDTARRSTNAEYADVHERTDWVSCGTAQPVSMAIHVAWRRWRERYRGGTVVTFEATLQRNGEPATDCTLAEAFLGGLAERARLQQKTTMF